MQDNNNNSVHNIGFVIATPDENNKFKVLLIKTKPGQWRLPSTPLAVALSHCDKDASEPFRALLNLGKTTFVNNVFFRDSRENGRVTRFYALQCTTPELALESASSVLACQARWASFEEAFWIVAAEELDVAQWGERLLANSLSH